MTTRPTSTHLDLERRHVRRLAVARAGLLWPERTELPRRAARGGASARRAAHAVISRFGYLQLDSVSVVGARSHALVLLSRLDGATTELAETLLGSDAPLFEYWGHEASWLPLHLYRYFEFRREEFRAHPWWGDLVAAHPRVARMILDRLRAEGPLAATAFRTGPARSGWWNLDVAKKVLSALWSRGDVAVSRRSAFRREVDLAERVIPPKFRDDPAPLEESLRTLVLRALAGHGWATRPTISATWRLRGLTEAVDRALRQLAEEGEVQPCVLRAGRRRIDGWIRPQDLELAHALVRARPRRARGTLLSPFDPLLWDRDRTELIFGFRQAIEIYKPAAQREFGYYCLPVLAGDRLVGRIDVKADRKKGRLRVPSNHWEAARPRAVDRTAGTSALERLATQLQLEPDILT